ncbi:MAG: peptidoglycan editing factor PgeF [Selenomonadaceae bacterium]|nr:peptidoglycan editing factor PgeF [Selenomonadaceae bacterium]
MSYFLRRTENNLWLGIFSTFPKDLVTHAVSTRIGGVSKEPFDSLNLALHVGDEPADVIANRKKFLRALGFKLSDIVTPNQVHGDKIFRVDENYRGCGCNNYADSIPETDALITDTPGLPLMLCFADCVPIFFVDTEKRAVGLAHGGWKGTLKKIAAKTLLKMNSEFGTRPQDCLIGIAPSIGVCCYEVGGVVIDKCKEAFPNDYERLLIQRDGKIFLDLQLANVIQLLEIGASEKNIEVSNHCTCCTSDWYFSYRAAQKKNLDRTGRIAALIALKEFN